MTIRECRCAHCGIRYSHQGSGNGCGEPLNDARYCPDCKQVIIDALQNVPKAVERFEIVVEGTERDEILVLRDQIDAPSMVVDGSPIHLMFTKPRQIRPGLYDSTGKGACMNVRVIHRDGVEYDICTWTDNREPEKVTKVMERELKTGYEMPWKNLYR